MPIDRGDAIRRRTVLRGGAAIAATALGTGPGLFPGGARLALAQGAKTLRAGIAGYNVINTLDPGKASLIPEFYVIWALYNGLVKFDAKMNIVPDLAESFKVTGDGTLEIKLRQGIKFHDGSSCTADDVKFSIERILDEKFCLAKSQQGLGDRQDRDRRSPEPAHPSQGARRPTSHFPRQCAHGNPDSAARRGAGGGRQFR